MPLVFAPGGRMAPPPRINEETVDAWAHCNDARCAGYGQQPVRGRKTIVEHTVGSRGGDGIFAMVVENTNEYLTFADPADIPCVSCGKDRMVSEQERPVIPALSGFPQSGLLGAPKFSPDVQHSPSDQQHAEEMAEMRKEMVAMAATIKGLKAPDTDAVG